MSFRRITAASIQAEWRAKAMALPLETRQAFLDLVWAGKTIGDARDAAGISMDEAMGIMDINLIRTAATTLNRVSA